MEEGYQNTDEHQADDKISPRPSFDDGDAHATPSKNIDNGDDDARRIPKPGTSE